MEYYELFVRRVAGNWVLIASNVGSRIDCEILFHKFCEDNPDWGELQAKVVKMRSVAVYTEYLPRTWNLRILEN